ncbi:conserved hypothetical protein [Talaromyces stipitatus ATCC 10500]|uniref:Nucleoporin NUP37 n=1 Tax=Talaromyces stipitatus (strain ATCC 10500 / CBS 375.48 / QM 6759 / NRRL 1006) TaxID=441959 RepID=B8MNG8_TALSN|nr:uncharacterized protein TSTA_102840 [Talaromyces stipitatus ATCC 10500]EED14057.1 conserved hypothetical protein [Talaromyces stipitatus ATCC 10500]
MAGSFKTPMVRRRDDGLQLSYLLPHRIFTSKPYPALAPNGSSIFIYGYDNGLRVVWRGGRTFLPSPRQRNVPDTRQKETPNNTTKNDDAIMIIDSDDEEPAPAASSNEDNIDYEIFEDEEVEIEPSRPYEPIIRHVDIPLGTKVLKLAVPSILPEKARSLEYTVPPILTASIVISVVCADSKLRVISLPLAPPHPSTKASDLKIQTLTLDATVSQNEIPKSVSVTFTCESNEADDDHSRSRSRQIQSPVTTGQWSLLVATHAAEASGTLLVYSLPIAQGPNGSYTLPTKNIKPLQKHLLPSSARTISFNPSPYPSARHTHLLVSFPDSCAKILACSTSSDKDATDEKPDQEGKWLLTLYPGFGQSANGLTRRKTIVDAAWVLSGKAVMVLLSDGEWGVWDIEGAGPGSEPGPLVGQSSIHGITGGSLTAYSISGRILGGPQTTNKSQTAVTEVQEQRGKFAPMTPSSRRVREDTLFKGAQPLAKPSFDGEISVVQINSSRTAMPEESILIRHGDQIATIPSLLSLWRSSVKASGTFDASNRCRVSPLAGINLYGERLNGLAHLPSPFRAETDSEEQQDYEILITAEHRLIILGRDLTPTTTTKPAQAPVPQPDTDTDQLMLSQGELDVDGMSRVLTTMSMRGTLQPNLQPAHQRNGFKSPIKRARIFS